MPKILTEVFIRNLQPAPKGQRLAIADAIVPGLKLRVTDKGAKTFVLWRRYPGGGRTSPSARALGRVGELTLAQARDKARKWLELIKQGKDPSETDRAAREAEAARRALKFSAVLGHYLTLHVKGQRKADAAAGRHHA